MAAFATACTRAYSQATLTGVHILVLWAFESYKMRTAKQVGLFEPGGAAGVHILVFCALESSKMGTPRQSWALRGGGAGGNAHFGVLKRGRLFAKLSKSGSTFAWKVGSQQSSSS